MPCCISPGRRPSPAKCSTSTAARTPDAGRRGTSMPYERIVGLEVTDQDGFTQYRTEMAPLLDAAGGEFRYDFDVARVLRGEKDARINRAFVIRFPDRSASEKFFADPRYLEIRRRLFEPSVSSTLLIAEYETDGRHSARP